ncbi:MAG TPA: cbb3-type cytochrome c oxidase N-terminal domain-containing protein, partial [Cytophagaceae bacterium]|nr:cbb3-type cytochrome c oxidase N-terminal domain-containing protein [Cytophagaceae bacterium]
MMKNNFVKNRISLLFGFLVLLVTDSFAQDAITVQKDSLGKDGGMLNPQVLLIFVLAVTFIITLVILYLLYALNVFMSSMKKTGEMKEVPVLLKFTDAVPIEREHEIMMDHNYDGIRELDNKLPPWWVYLFYGTIVFGVFYMWFYHIYGSGDVQEQEYIKELAEAEVQMKANASKVDENSVTMLTDAARIKKGETIFATNCAPCHGKKGEGTVGPNLTDNYWLHGGNIKDIFKSIKYGIPAKGMIPWQTQLGPGQI